MRRLKTKARGLKRRTTREKTSQNTTDNQHPAPCRNTKKTNKSPARHRLLNSLDQSKNSRQMGNPEEKAQGSPNDRKLYGSHGPRSQATLHGTPMPTTSEELLQRSLGNIANGGRHRHIPSVQLDRTASTTGGVVLGPGHTLQQREMLGKLHQIRNKRILIDMGRHSSHEPGGWPIRTRLGSLRGRSATSRPDRIPPIPRNNGKRSSGPSPGTSPIRLQNRPKRRGDSTLGTNLPTFGDRTPDPPRMVKGNGENRQNKKIYISGRISNPIRPQTQRTRLTAMCGLQGIECRHNPEPISPTTHAGTTGPGTRRPMVYKDGLKKRIQPHTNSRRR